MTFDDAEALARKLMDKHGLRRWGFSFMNSVRLLGRCRCMYKRDYTLVGGTISLDREFVLRSSLPKVRGVILHEIAHALVADPNISHGPVFVKMARKIGCSRDETKPYGPPIKRGKRRCLTCQELTRNFERYNSRNCRHCAFKVWQEKKLKRLIQRYGPTVGRKSFSYD